MVKGIGVDIIEVQRVKRLLEGDRRFAERLFTAAEIAYCRGKHYSAQHYAARFTAKEAFFKALGSGWRDGMGWHEVEVVNDKLGKPSLRLRGKARERFAALKLKRLHLSISHTREHAVALVVVE